MKKYLLMLIAIVSCLCSLGCWVVSINPFYTEDTEITYTEINGKWKLVESTGSDVSDKNIDLWTINSTSSNTIESYDEYNRRGNLQTAYFSIDGDKFVDFMAGDEECISEYFGAMLYPVHNLCKIEIVLDTLFLIPIDYSFLQDLVLAENKPALDYFLPEDDDQLMLYTEKSAGWVEFLRKYKDIEGFFDAEHTTVLVRASG